MKLVVAEKPSVAQSLAAVLGAKEKKDGYLEGGGWLVSWCVGHLVELAQPEAYGEQYAKWRYADLPILPAHWKYDVAKDKKKQLGVLRRLMEDKRVDAVVCATDAGREGELIFRLVYQQAGCSKPILRLWISSMEDAAIRDGFEHLRPGADYDLLYQAALCRAGADWLVGINATRLFSVLYGDTLNVGRVMTPTLALIVQREDAIRSFKSKPFYVPELACGGFTAAGEKLEDKAAAETIRAACDGKPAVVRKVERQKKTVQPPRLYDLTTLQRECNRLYGFTAQQTLDYLQSLYEKKLATYPRTDSQYITADMQATVGSLALWLWQNMPFGKDNTTAPELEGIIDDSKVTDHHAILPTVEIARTDLSALPGGERDVLMLLACRLLCATAQPHHFEAVLAVLESEGHTFTAKGKTVLHAWADPALPLFSSTLSSPRQWHPDSGHRSRTVFCKNHSGAVARRRVYSLMWMPLALARSTVCFTLFMNSILGDIMYVCPAIGAAVLAFTKVEKQKDLQRVLSNDVLFTVAGVFVMADALSASGAGIMIGEFILGLMGENPSGLTVMFVFAIVGVTMTQLMTNSGTKNVLLPLSVATAVAAGWHPRGLCLLVNTVCSCAAFLPSGAPSTAIAFAAGGYKFQETFLWALGFSVITIVTFVFSINFFFPVF